MSLSLTHILLALGAALSFCLSFIAAGMVAVSGAFMLAGLAAIAWLARSLVRETLRHADRPRG